ncbi:MAG TPA: lamin tail domain-containing protein [Stenomitos sp.]
MQTGSLLLVAALPNPEGSESGEWVELKNTSSEAFALEGWFLTDKIGRRRMLEGTLAPNEQKQVLVRTNSPQSMQLGNSGGRILLCQPNGEMVVSVFYNKTTEGEIITF